MSAKATSKQLLSARDDYESWLKQATGRVYRLQLPMVFNGETVMVKFVRRKRPGQLVQPAVFVEARYIPGKDLYNVRTGSMDGMADVTSERIVRGVDAEALVTPKTMLGWMDMSESNVDAFVSLLVEKTTTVEPTLTQMDNIEADLNSEGADEDKFSWMTRHFTWQFGHLDGPDIQGFSKPAEALLQKWWRLMAKPYGWTLRENTASWKYRHHPAIEIVASGGDIMVYWGGFSHRIDLSFVDSYARLAGLKTPLSKPWRPQAATNLPDPV